MSVKLRVHRGRLRRGGPWALALSCCAMAAFGDGGLPGDVNLDGAVNVLDVQGSINMALGAAEGTSEADADMNAAVDVRDVQAIINTALGTGGLVQPAMGSFGPEGLLPGARVVAVALDGRRAEAPVDPETGAFELLLGVRTAWSFAVFAGQNASQTAATVAFPLVYGHSTTLPLPDLAVGGPLDLGALEMAWGALPSEDLRALLAGIAAPLDRTDADADGLPDFLDDLLAPLFESPADLGLDLPDDLDVGTLIEMLGGCIDDVLPQLVTPDLTGIELGGIPAFLEPAWQCLESSLFDWIDSSVIPISDDLITAYTNLVLAWLNQQVTPWLNEMGRPELEDTNGNFVPDFLESLICGPAPSAPCLADANGDGIPDFCGDSDSDGIANLFDPDTWVADDLDGDGVPNETDVDDDGDGVPDYAEAT